MADDVSDPADRKPEGDSPDEQSTPWAGSRTPASAQNRALADRLESAKRTPTPKHRAAPEAPRRRAVVAPPPPPPPAPTRPRRETEDREYRRLAVAILVGVAVFATIVGLGYLANSNKSRADDWERRAFRLDRNTEVLNGLLTERSTQLNERTRELNALARKVGKQQTALSRSESDVASLSERQSQLAAEKARLEDSRAAIQQQSTALRSVAESFVTCKNGLAKLLAFTRKENDAAANRIAGDVGRSCSRAESNLASYRGRYGS